MFSTSKGDFQSGPSPLTLSHYRWMESGRSAEIRSLDLDRSDNLSEAVIRKFIDMHHLKLEGLVLTGMGQISDMLFITELNKTKVWFTVMLL